MIKKILKLLGRLAAGILGIAFLLYLVLVVINWRDAPPSEAARHLSAIHANRPAVSDEQNGFINLLGMLVAADQEPMRAGVAMAERARNGGERASAAGYNHPDYPQLDLNKGRSSGVAALIDRCRSMAEQCFALLRSPQDAVSFSETDELLLQRYRTLISKPSWYDILPQGFEGAIPSYTPAVNGQTLSLYDIWANAESRGAQATVAMLDADARFWRNVMSSSDLLISSMVAVNGLRRNLLWSNLVMQRLAGKGDVAEIPATWGTPFSDEERRLERAWAGEWTISAEGLRSIHFREILEAEGRSSFSAFILGMMAEPLFLRQETINLAADDFAQLTTRLVVPYEQLPAVIVRMGDVSVQRDLSALSIFDNPIGRVLHATGIPDFSAYMLRVPDLEGGRRALFVTLELRNNKTPHHEVAAALAASTWRNPYTNEPFSWDEATGSVLFEGLGEGTNRHYLFAY